MDVVAAPGVAVHAAIEAVSHTYPGVGPTGPVHALGPVDMQVRQGEFVAVVGPSGCGKSTLLELLCGLVRPSTGRISFEGRPLDGPADGIGVVFQQDASFPWLRVRDNVEFGLRQLDLTAQARREKVDGALAFMGLTDFAEAYPAQLSGGMRQRVCIARTLVLEPRLLLLDEPFGALDAQTRLLMGEELLAVWRRTGASALLITHSLEEAVMLADRVCVMSARPGRIIHEATTGWPAERDSTIMEDARFGDITAELWHELRAQSMRALRGEAKG